MSDGAAAQAAVTLIIVISLSLRATGAAAAEPTAAATPDRDRVGLVLGGGSARGLAHIGALKALETLQVPVDVIAGASMGSVVGSLYAAGYSASDIARIARSQDWYALFDDGAGRAGATFRRKSDDIGFLTDFRLVVDDGRLALPDGAIQGQNLSLVLSTLLVDARALDAFSNLPIPFYPVAMDLSTGEKVVMDRGDLVTATLASMSLPGLLPPVEREARSLIDGGFVDNLPIGVARERGADRTVVVAVGSDPLDAAEVTGLTGVLRQTQVLLLQANIDAQRATLTDRDVLIEPVLDEFDFASFDAVDTLIDRGEAAVLDRADEFAELRLDDAAWAAHLDGRRRTAMLPERIDAVRLVQDSALSDAIVARAIRARAGEPLDPVALAEDIDALYATGLFDRIDYRIERASDANVLTVDARAHAATRGFYRFGLALESDLDDTTSFEAGIAWTAPSLNRLGGELRFKGTVGDRSRAIVELYQPFGPLQRLFVEPSLSLLRDRSNTFEGGDGLRGKRRRSAIEASLQGGLLFGRRAELRVGIGQAGGDLERDEADAVPVGDLPDDDKSDFRDTSAFVQWRFDSLDDLAWPREGLYAVLRHTRHDDVLGGDLRFDETSLQTLWPITRSRDTLTLQLRASAATGRDAGFLEAATLGGFLSLSGFADDALAGNAALFASATGYRRLNAQSLLFDTPLYAGVSFETGNVFDTTDDVSTGDLIVAGSAFVGADTPIGPVFLGYGRNDTDASQWYFSIGSFF